MGTGLNLDQLRPIRKIMTSRSYFVLLGDLGLSQVYPHRVFHATHRRLKPQPQIGL
jgi:hypothetical protein